MLPFPITCISMRMTTHIWYVRGAQWGFTVVKRTVSPLKCRRSTHKVSQTTHLSVISLRRWRHIFHYLKIQLLEIQAHFKVHQSSLCTVHALNSSNQNRKIQRFFSILTNIFITIINGYFDMKNYRMTNIMGNSISQIAIYFPVLSYTVSDYTNWTT